MESKGVCTILYVLILLLMGGLHVHRVYATGATESILPIVLRIAIAGAIILSMATKRYALSTRNCATLQFGVFLMNFIADQTFIGH